MTVVLRKGTNADAALIAEYLKKLAEYEKLSEDCTVSPATVSELMNEENGLNAIIAERDGAPLGIMTYYFYKIATFSGKRVLYIEDVFIDEENRGEGIGAMLFAEARRIAEGKGCARLEWKCLDWNTSAQKFYSKIGGEISDDGWLTYSINLN